MWRIGGLHTSGRIDRCLNSRPLFRNQKKKILGRYFTFSYGSFFMLNHTMHVMCLVVVVAIVIARFLVSCAFLCKILFYVRLSNFYASKLWAGSAAYITKSWAIFATSGARNDTWEAKEWDEETWSLACLWGLAGDSYFIFLSSKRFTCWYIVC